MIKILKNLFFLLIFFITFLTLSVCAEPSKVMSIAYDDSSSLVYINIEQTENIDNSAQKIVRLSNPNRIYFDINNAVLVGSKQQLVFEKTNIKDIIKNKFPNVNFRIYTGSSKELLDMVKENHIDFALITTPFKTTDDIEIFNILPLEDILIAPNSYKDKITGPVSIKDLTKYPFVLLNNDMQYREHIDEFLFSNKTKITPTYELDNSGIIINLVEYGYGLSFAPTIMAAPLLEKNKVFKIELKEEIPTRYIAFAIKKDVIYSK